MKAEQFSRALGEIKEEYLEETLTYQRKRKPHWGRWGIMAACLAMVAICIVGGAIGQKPEENTENVDSLFAIRAYAADGELEEMDVNVEYFDSGTAGGNVFGVDMPLFNFWVHPTEWDGNGLIWDRYDISVSYDGKTAEGKDEHISLGYVMPAQGVEASMGYWICGWFEEPTDILVTITEKQTGEIVEVITVNVTYLPEEQGYQLMVTDVTASR